VKNAGRLKPEIDIAFCLDDAFAPHVAAAIASVVSHSRNSSFRFIILYSNVSVNSRARIELCAPLSRFHWVEIKDEDVPTLTNGGRFTRAILFRLALDRLAPPDCRRVIYLDSDVIVTADISKLWRTNLERYSLGAVVDSYTDPQAFALRWSLPHSANGYFNSGVLLIDLERVRIEGSLLAAAVFASGQGRGLEFVDQDALNWAFWNKWQPLDVIWNVQRHMVISALKPLISAERQLKGRRPGIVHYTGEEKPWAVGAYHPWAWLYWKSLARTPFFEDALSKNGVTIAIRSRMWLRWLRHHPFWLAVFGAS
jgi:lipopolysaccharide biosynthesis glycosyltransferase